MYCRPLNFPWVLAKKNVEEGEDTSEFWAAVYKADFYTANYLIACTKSSGKISPSNLKGMYVLNCTNALIARLRMRKHKFCVFVKDQGAKETPIERLKRLRAAQLNKTFQKEMLTNTEKKAREERDRAARLQIEKAAYSRRPRSPSPNSRLSEFSLHDLSPRRRKKFVAVELTGINIQLSSCFGRMKQKLAGLQKQAYRSELCFRISDQVCIVRLHSAVLIEVLTPTHSS